ncbi:MAG: transposase [Gammaproteobacteria bacterium]
MSEYHRLYVPNGTYFFTVVARDRQPLFSDASNTEKLHAAFHYALSRRPFEMDALVILPDHLHCLWTMTADADYSTRWQMIKTQFSRSLGRETHKNNPFFWQKRFWEHLIRDENDFHRHLDYIHYNPVKHGYVRRPGEWRHSSFPQFVSCGFYNQNWGSSEPERMRDLDFE